MTRRLRRLSIIAACGVVLAAAAGLTLTALQDGIVFFRSPTEVASSGKVGARIRLGGIVLAGSVRRGSDQSLAFSVTDGAGTVPVVYRGIVPDLFREGQGVVTEGSLSQSGVFTADTLLARHDEKYMPREVVDALKAQQHWNPGS